MRFKAIAALLIHRNSYLLFNLNGESLQNVRYGVNEQHADIFYVRMCSAEIVIEKLVDIGSDFNLLYDIFPESGLRCWICLFFPPFRNRLVDTSQPFVES